MASSPHDATFILELHSLSLCKLRYTIALVRLLGGWDKLPHNLCDISLWEPHAQRIRYPPIHPVHILLSRRPARHHPLPIHVHEQLDRRRIGAPPRVNLALAVFRPPHVTVEVVLGVGFGHAFVDVETRFVGGGEVVYEAVYGGAVLGRR